MFLPNQAELLKLFSSFLSEAGLSTVSIKNYLCDLRHFLSFCASTSSVIPIKEIFQNLNRFLEPYVKAQQSAFTPKSTTNRRMASIRRFTTFLSVKFDVQQNVFTQQNTSHSNIKTVQWPHINHLPEISQVVPPLKTLTSDKILQQFKVSLEKEKRTHSTIKNYLSDLNHFFLWTANQTPFTTQNLFNILSEIQLQAYITYLKLSHTSTSVLNRRQSSIKKLARFCFSEGYIPRNPFEIKPPVQKLAPLAWIERLARKPKTPPSGRAKNRFAIWYDKYNALSWTPYLNIALLVLATTAMAIFAYNQIIGQARPSAATTALTPPKRQLSFQGRLTDSSGTPITTAVSVVFKLFNALTGPTQLYTTGTCSITPDSSGIFNSLIGDTVCGAEIPSSVFTDNRDVFLEVTVGAETLTPRQQIATVGYALNSETLQGYPASASAVENTIPVMNNSGDIILGSASPDIKSTSGNFNIEGQSVSIKTTASSGGSIVLQPDAIGGVGNVQVITANATGNQFRVEDVNLTTGNLISGYVGNGTATGRLLSLSSDYGSSNLDKFYVAVDGRTKVNATSAAGWPALTVNQTSTGDLISASASGVAKFTVTNGGNVDIAGQYMINGTPISTGGSNWQLTSGSLTPLEITNALTLGATATASAIVSLPGTTNNDAVFTLGTGDFTVSSANFDTTATGINATNIGATTPGTGAFTTLSSTGVTTIGNNSATVAIDSSDWNIDATGAMSGIGAIALNGAITGATGFNGLVVTANTGVVTTGTWNASVIGLTYGGTNKNMTAVNGGVVWTDADSMEVSAAGLSGQVLVSNGAAAPSWSATSAVNFWQRNSGALTPLEITNALTLGATATASALVHFPGTNNQDAFFNLGTGNVGIGTTAPAELLQVGTGGVNTSRRAIRVGSSYGLNIQHYINSNADSAIFQNAYIDGGSGAAATYNWNTSHASFGSRGISFGYSASGGITFYADSVATTADTAFTPTARMFIRNDGNVGIGDTSPASMFTVGAADLFQVNSSGNIVKINNVTTSFPASQGATGSLLTNSDGAGTLTWGSPSGTGILGYWTRNGTDLYNTNQGDNVGIGTTNPTNTLHVVGTNGMVRISDVETDATNKNVRIVGTHYTTAEEPMAMLYAQSTSTANTLILGGGSALMNASTIIAFNTAANNTTVTGTERMRIDSAGSVGIGTTAPGALLDVSSATGNPTFQLSDGDVAHGMTGLLPTNALFRIQNYSSSAGGAWILGAGDALNVPGITLQGVIGVADPTDTVPALLLNGSKSNGTTSYQAMGALETAFQVETGTVGSGTKLMTILGSGNVGIGTTAPAYKLEVTDTTSPILAITPGSNTTADPTLYLMDTTTSAGFKLWYDNSVGATYFDNKYNNAAGSMFFRTEVDGTAINALTILGGGNVGIGDTTPASMFTVGAADLFQVNSSGNIVKINNVTTSFPASQGAANSTLINNGSGVLSWLDPTAASGTIGYWTRSSSHIYPTNINDPVAIGFSTAMTNPGMGGGLTALQVDGDILPLVNDDAYLGRASSAWKRLYLSLGINDSTGAEQVSIANRQLTGGQWNATTFLRVGDTTNTMPAGGMELFVSGDASISGTLKVWGDITVQSGIGKIDVGTIDPPYTINGEKYATYMAGMVGIKEEMIGKITTSEYISGLGYRALINLDSQPKGSDLWLFSKTTDIRNHLDQLSVLLTAAGQAKTWYEIDTPNKILAIYSSTPTDINFRLSAPRFDSANWLNTRTSEASGFVLNSPDFYTSLTDTGFFGSAIEPELIVLADNSFSLKVNGQETKEVSSFFQSIIANLKVGTQVVTTLLADNLTIRTKLISPIADIDQLKVVDATVSGTLYADSIKGKTVDKLTTQLDLLSEKYSTASAILADLQAKYTSYDSLIGNINNTATASGDLPAGRQGLSAVADPLALSPLASASANIPSDLILNSLSVHTIYSNDLMADGSIFAQSFSSIDTDLFIQPTGDKPVHLLANLMTLYPDGKVVINGDLIITGTLFANNLDTKTATVSGTLAVGSSTIATGSANFDLLTTGGLVIASSSDDLSATMSAQTASNTTIGTATIASGSAEISIANTKVTDHTLIYITPISDTSNQVLYVKSKQTGVGFTVAMPTNPILVTQPISFNFWLVETK